MPFFDYAKQEQIFRGHKDALWGSLSRQNNMFMVANISLFFLTGLVNKGYFYTFISLGCLAIAGVGMVVPVPVFARLWYYSTCLAFHLVGLYFLVSSVWYWVHTGALIK